MDKQWRKKQHLKQVKRLKQKQEKWRENTSSIERNELFINQH